MNNEKSEKVNCFKCKHFAVSWDPRFPRTCKLYGFKTARIPSVAVFESSGYDCEGYEKKDITKA